VSGENIQLVKVKRDKPAAGLMRQHSAFFRNFYDKKFLPKCELIKDTDIYDSVAYIEAQTDILTAALLEILPEDSSYRELLTAAGEHSVLKMKDEASIMAMLNKDKGGFRQKQRAYREKRKLLTAKGGGKSGRAAKTDKLKGETT
jgi:hypothetical protein